MVWCTLLVVAGMRLLMPREPFIPQRGFVWRFDGQQRFQHPRSWDRPPVEPLPTNLWRLEIEVSSHDLQVLRRYHWGGWNGDRQERPEVHATVREGGVEYHDVALHLKGAAGSFRSIDDKPAMTLNFSKNVPDQKFHGYSKISLNNSVQDPSFLTEIVCRELFEAAHVPVPKADHVTVILNDRDLNLYVLTEGWGKSFLKRYFKDTSGNLYDGGFLQEVTGDLSVNSGDHRENHSDLDRLARAASISNAAERWDQLNRILDMDRFLSFVALEIMTCHWDGYALNRNNYRVFHDVETDRMIFMPHGMDQMFGVTRSSPNAPIQPGMQGLVARAVASTPQGRRMLLERIETLRTNLFLPAILTNRVRELDARIRPTLAAYDPSWARAHDSEVEDLCERILQRAQSISDQLGSPHQALSFDKNGVAQLTGWNPRVTTADRRSTQFERLEQDGQKVLHVVSTAKGSASWRIRVPLESGRYRFEGRGRVGGVRSSGGVCLRISGARVTPSNPGQDQWAPFTFSFGVEEPMAEVELVCELNSAGGEAWFDEDSLRLTRE